MRKTKVSHILQLTFMPSIMPINCYLVEEHDSLTLVDAALSHHAKAIIKTAQSLNKPIQRIVLTHAHDDHVGALDTIKQSLPDVKVYISNRDAKLLKGDRSLEPDELQVPIKGGIPKHIKTIPDVLLQDGDRIGSLQAIETPGHTPGSMSFIDTRSGYVIAGDAFQTRGGLAVSGQMRVTFPFPALATWSAETALTSAEKLLSLKPALLAVGHGQMLHDPLPHMNQAIESARRRLSPERSS